MTPPSARSWTVRDAARTSLQSAAAGGATWLVMTRLALPHESWAIISALYVVSQSTDGTWRSAIARVAGTLAGTAIGAASVWLLGGEDTTALRVALAALAASAMTSFRPGWRFGIVAATIVALEQGEVAAGGTLDRVLAILVGTTTGLLAAFLVWPESAVRRARRAIAQALRSCNELLDAGLDIAMGAHGELADIHRRFLRQAAIARAAAGSVRRGGQRQALCRQVETLERLWHMLIVIDRLATQDWGLAAERSEQLSRVLPAVRRQAAQALDDMQDPSKTAPDLDALDHSVEEIARLARGDDGGREDGGDPSALGALAFALVETCKHLRELHALRAPGEDRPRTGGASGAD